MVSFDLRVSWIQHWNRKHNLSQLHELQLKTDASVARPLHSMPEDESAWDNASRTWSLTVFPKCGRSQLKAWNFSKKGQRHCFSFKLSVLTKNKTISSSRVKCQGTTDNKVLTFPRITIWSGRVGFTAIFSSHHQWLCCCVKLLSSCLLLPTCLLLCVGVVTHVRIF